MNADQKRLKAMNAEIERLYREGRDTEARNLEARANALARRIWYRLPNDGKFTDA